MFASFLNAAWSTSPRLESQCGYWCTVTEASHLSGHAAPCKPNQLTQQSSPTGREESGKCRKSCCHSSPRTHGVPTRLCGMRWIAKGNYDTVKTQQHTIAGTSVLYMHWKITVRAILGLPRRTSSSSPRPFPPRLLRSVRVCSAHTQTLTVLTDSTYHEVWYSLNGSFHKQLTSRGSRLWTV